MDAKVARVFTQLLTCNNWVCLHHALVSVAAYAAVCASDECIDRSVPQVCVATVAAFLQRQPQSTLAGIDDYATAQQRILLSAPSPAPRARRIATAPPLPAPSPPQPPQTPQPALQPTQTPQPAAQQAPQPPAGDPLRLFVQAKEAVQAAVTRMSAPGGRLDIRSRVLLDEHIKDLRQLLFHSDNLLEQMYH
eukprot:TRINITY_DN2477_c0_g1_i10.p2 TRINITY_DN2477_c0_g1~~TRINITY_DN2477_c0_g1_i10.p2  ORF type:complete len:192 (-),score=63.29 TRINITY_DN2477_c0_g1_i10:124-699(-)